MKYEVLYNFISPVTGKLYLPTDYILVGDENGYSEPSSILIDMGIDIIGINKKLDEIQAGSFILQKPLFGFNNSQALNSLGVGVLKVIPDGVLQLAKGGKSTTNDDYIRPIDLKEEIDTTNTTITNTKNELTTDYTGKITATQVNLEAQIGVLSTAVTGLAGAGAMASLVNFTYTTVTGAIVDAKNQNFVEYNFETKYKPLLSENKYFETDNLDLWGKGNIWYDCKNSNSNSQYRPGLRIVAWDSSWVFENQLCPISIGLFGYKWETKIFTNDIQAQEGFVWQADMENNSSHENYRFPKKLSLRYVGHDNKAMGWNRVDEELMSYNKYEENFTFEKTININQYTIYQSRKDIPSEDGSVFLHNVKI